MKCSVCVTKNSLVSIAAKFVLVLSLLLIPAAAHAGGGDLPPLGVTKTGPATAQVGDVIVYEVALTAGKGDYNKVDIHEVAPKCLDFVPEQSSRECMKKSGTLGCWIDGIWKNMTKKFNIAFRVTDKCACEQQIVNQVDVKAKNAPANWAKAMTVIKCEKKKIIVTKTGPATVGQGGTINYSIAVTNPGTSPLENVAVYDAIPEGLNFVGTTNPECSKQGNAVVCNLGTLGAGQTKTIGLAFEVKSNAAVCGKQIVNQVDVSAKGAEPNWAKAMTQVTCEKKKIIVTKTGAAVVNAGENITYTIAVTNPNTTPLTNVSLYDGLVQGLSYVPNASDATCSANQQAVTCTKFTLAPGETKTFNLTFAIAATAQCDKQVINQVDVRADDAEPNWAKAMSTVKCPKRTILVTKTGPAKVLQGGNISYTITVTNPNQVELQNVSVYDGAVAGLTFIENGSSPECRKNAQAVVCDGFNLAAGASKSFTLVFKVSATAACESQIVNQVDVSAKNTDPNWAKAMTRVECIKPAASPILPLLECVYDMGNGTYRAYFGYENTGQVAHTIPAGTHTDTTLNTFLPEPKDRGQPSTFQPGRVKAAFFVDFDGTEIHWKVRPENGALNFAAASKNSAACKPVEPIAECVDKKPGNKFNALFGYQNSNNFEIKIPIGASNKFVPAPEDRGQPNQFFTGRVASAFNVEFATENLTWKLANRQAVAKFGTQARCTPGSPPTCSCGVSQNVACQGATTKVHLDGTGSKDPDGQPLTYQWSTDCPNSNLDNATAAKPVLTIDTSSGQAVSCTATLTVSDGVDSSSCTSPITVAACNIDCAGVPNGSGKVDLCGVCNGNNACVDCAGVPNGNAKVDKCGICGGNDTCVDCAGVPNGNGKPDQCGVCNGDGKSCINCNNTDITDQLMGMDIAAAVQKNIVLKASKKVGKLSGEGNKALALDATKEANALYQRMWTETWGLGRSVTNCANAAICTQTDRITTLASYNTDSVRLRDIALELSRACTASSSGKARTACRRIANDANDAHQAALQSVTQVPRFNTTCQ